MRSNIVFTFLAVVFVFPTGCDESNSESANSQDSSLETLEDSPDTLTDRMAIERMLIPVYRRTPLVMMLMTQPSVTW